MAEERPPRAAEMRYLPHDVRVAAIEADQHVIGYNRFMKRAQTVAMGRAYAKPGNGGVA